MNIRKADMSRTIEIQVYSYSELEPKAKERAKSWIVEGIDCSESLMHMFIPQLHDAGYPTLNVNYSFSYSQGDGVAFFSSGTWPDFNKPTGVWRNLGKEYASLSVNLVRVWFRRIAKYYDKDKKRELYRLYTTYVVPGFVELAVRIGRRGSNSYSHYNSMDTEFFFNICDREALAAGDEAAVEHMAKDFEEYLADDVKDMSKALEKEGYAEIEYQRSDENVAEIAEVNDYQFLKSGKPAGLAT